MSSTPTFLFTDIEGSTALYERAGPIFRTALAIHHAALRSAIEKHAGRVFHDTGDGLLSVFENPADAVAAATDAQFALDTAAWPAEVGALRVRMGLHLGPVETDGDRFQGLTMHHAARVMGAANGGQILCSPAVREQLSPVDGQITDLGLYRLRGLPAAMRLFQVASVPGHPPFPPLNALPAFTHSLPVSPSRYFGRDAEIAELTEILRPLRTRNAQPFGRLVTLLGPGGTGKTRLSLEVACRLLPEYSHAVWFVPLADVRDPALILEKVRETLGLPSDPSTQPLAQVAHFLAAQPSLLILDNFEQILPDGALPVHELLAAAPSLACLISSRIRLDLGAEQEFPVQPLRLPALDATPADLREFPSVALFIDRARNVRRDFTLTPENARDIAQLCRVLEGIPLAIELAAARSGALTPAQMLTRLGHRLDFLAGGRRDLPERHRTLRAAIAWSYELLPEQLQLLFAKLAVFRGGWTLEAAEAIATDDPPEAAPTLDQLEELRACSLISTVETHGIMRFTMLEILREFAAERLTLTGQQEACTARHLTYFTTFATSPPDADELTHLRLLDADHENLRALLGSSAPIEDRTHVAIALRKYWMIRGHIVEGRTTLDRCIEEESDPTRRAALHTEAGILAWKAVDFPAADDHFRAALAVHESLGNQTQIAGTLNNLSILANESGRHEDAHEFCQRSIAIYRRLDRPSHLAAALSNFASGKLAAETATEAREPLEEALEIQRRLGEQLNAANTLHNLAEMHLALGAPAQARRHLGESLRIRTAHGACDDLCACFSTLGSIAVAEADPERAALLFAAASQAAENHDTPASPATRERLNADIANVRATLGPERFAALWPIGCRLALGEVLDAEGRWLVHPAPATEIATATA